MFIASDERILFWSWTLWHWRQMHFMLEINISVLEMNELKMHVQTLVTHIHVASYQQHPNTTYLEMIASHSYSPSNTDAIMLWRSKRYLQVLYIHNRVFYCSKRSLKRSGTQSKPKHNFQPHTQLATSKLVAAYFAWEVKQVCEGECVAYYRQFQGHSSLILAHTYMYMYV